MSEYPLPSDAENAARQAHIDHSPLARNIRLIKFVRRLNVRAVEFVSLFLLVILADQTLYVGQGYAGIAVFIAAAVALTAVGASQRTSSYQLSVILALLSMAVSRLLWCGNFVAVMFSGFLLLAFAHRLAGGRLTIADICRLPLTFLQSSVLGLLVYQQWLEYFAKTWGWGGFSRFTKLIPVIIPVIAAGVFSVIFALANPDLFKWLWNQLDWVIKALDAFIMSMTDAPLRMLFWLGALLAGVGLLRFGTRNFLKKQELQEVAMASAPAVEPAPYFLYSTFRNTLISLIALFAAYLLFEFTTMWTRTFPPNFYYAGYAHEGAFWLTLALGLATLMLSLIFRGKTLADQRLPFLKKLGVLWSVLNLLLAIAVFNRLFIYIDFNGMTRMRVVGLFGVTTVVAGLLLVMWKIRRGHSFAWLIRRQTLALGMACFLYAVLPVDAYVTNFDVRQVLSGDLKPSVQIAHHPTSTEGMLMLFPLLECSNPIIREGIASRLASVNDELQSQTRTNWTAKQLAESLFLKKFQQHSVNGQLTSSRHDQPLEGNANAWEDFKTYSFQWY